METNEARTIKVTFPDKTEVKVPENITLYELSKDFQEKFCSDIIAAKVNNDIRELSYKLEENCFVEFIDYTYEDGMRIYRRSLQFLLVKAVHELFPKRKVVILHSIGNGLYCELQGGTDITEDEAAAIENKMRQLVEQKIPFVKKIVPIEEAREMFVKNGQLDKFRVFEYRKKPYVTLYGCGDLLNYFYGYMVPDTGYLKTFELRYYNKGILLRFPDKKNPYELPQFTELKKLFNIFEEHREWIKILEIEDVGSLNDIIKAGHVEEIIRISEALHEKKIAQIADAIATSGKKKKLILISGPSSSGKTTFAKRLAVQLRVNGLKPVTISIDDYFLNRELTPRDENGDYDFEALEAVDMELFNNHLSALILGEEVETPIFNFQTGRREKSGKKLKLSDDHIILVEGIHGLNEKLTRAIPRELKYKIYLSAITSLNIDNHNRIPSTDIRILRRIVRDVQFRGASPVSTLQRWPSVRRGELKNIFPYQEEADIMFNSSLVYELGTLKVYAEPYLTAIDESYAEYPEAKRLLEFLSYFLPIDSREIPNNSILREFIGGSCFYR